MVSLQTEAIKGDHPVWSHLDTIIHSDVETLTFNVYMATRFSNVLLGSASVPWPTYQ